MKKLPFLLLLLSLGCGPDPLEQHFFIEGNCMECGPVIVDILLSTPGVKAAHWSFETSFASVVFDPSEIQSDQIQEIVAFSGFNTAYFDADADARASLPACCQEPISRKLEQFLPAHP